MAYIQYLAVESLKIYTIYCQHFLCSNNAIDCLVAKAKAQHSRCDLWDGFFVRLLLCFLAGHVAQWWSPCLPCTKP